MSKQTNTEPKHVTIDGEVYVKATNLTRDEAWKLGNEIINAAYERGTEAEQPEKPVRDNLACAEVKLDKIDELTAQVNAHLAAERAYLSGEAGYYE